jgi:hypothetical protein
MNKLLLLLVLTACAMSNQNSSCYGLTGRDLEECTLYNRSTPYPNNLIPPQEYWR